MSVYIDTQTRQELYDIITQCRTRYLWVFDALTERNKEILELKESLQLQKDLLSQEKELSMVLRERKDQLEKTITIEREKYLHMRELFWEATELQNVRNVLAERNKEIRESREKLARSRKGLWDRLNTRTEEVIQASRNIRAMSAEVEYWKNLYNRGFREHRDTKRSLEDADTLNRRLTKELLEILDSTGNIEL